ncbi:hypothetical protein FM036_40470, partial [Nostoc sp. HG1]|nr:hypothetical protein [Nostoc sp. HG1]
DRFEGEAKFLRGLFYFNLVRLFGDVQLVTTSTEDPNEGYTIPRAPAAKLYEQIISDLSAAETLCLPPRPIRGGGGGGVNQHRTGNTDQLSLSWLKGAPVRQLSCIALW